MEDFNPRQNANANDLRRLRSAGMEVVANSNYYQPFNAQQRATAAALRAHKMALDASEGHNIVDIAPPPTVVEQRLPQEARPQPEPNMPGVPNQAFNPYDQPDPQHAWMGQQQAAPPPNQTPSSSKHHHRHRHSHKKHKKDKKEDKKERRDRERDSHHGRDTDTLERGGGSSGGNFDWENAAPAPIDDNVWQAIQQMQAYGGPGAHESEFQKERFHKKIVRTIEVPVETTVKVPVMAQEEITAVERKKIPVKKKIEEPGFKVVQQPYTKVVPKERTRLKEVWVKQLVPETYTTQEIQHLVKEVRVPTINIREVETVEEVDVPVRKVVQVPSYRIDKIVETKQVEVLGVQEFDLVPRTGAFHVVKTRPTDRVSGRDRVLGREAYRATGTNLEFIPTDYDEAPHMDTSRMHESFRVV